MFLRTLRHRGSFCKPPSLSLQHRCEKNIENIIQEVELSTKYCAALLKDLPALQAPGGGKSTSFFDKLRQEYQGACQAVQGYSQYIFKPTSRKAFETDKQNPSIRNACRRLGEHIQDLDGTLEGIHKQYGWSKMKPLEKMPARSPWEAVVSCIALQEIFGGRSPNRGIAAERADRIKAFEARLVDKTLHLSNIRRVVDAREEEKEKEKEKQKYDKVRGGAPRMTFCMLNESEKEKEPIIVLGFTAPAWRNADLRDWAVEQRGQEIARYRDGTCISRRKEAIQKLGDIKNEWSKQRLTSTVDTFRQHHKLRPYGEGPRGFSIQFPGLVSRRRCAVCLASTEFSITAEDGLDLEGALDLTPRFPELAKAAERCAEVESTIVEEEIGFEEKHSLRPGPAEKVSTRGQALSELHELAKEKVFIKGAGDARFDFRIEIL
ncbi:MAG: hypothetical protein Q9225_007129 [Loekoesia sp. 1 TL-2023]